jgi:hypothetical protein
MAIHWLLRVGNGEDFIRSSSKLTWGFHSSSPSGKTFLANVTPGDVLWFVKSESKGLLMAVARLDAIKPREVGPLIAVTATNEELGWTRESEPSDMEIKYIDMFNISMCGLHSEILSPLTIRKYSEKCKVNLPLEYANIVRYSKVTGKM